MQCGQQRKSKVLCLHVCLYTYNNAPPSVGLAIGAQSSRTCFVYMGTSWALGVYTLRLCWCLLLFSFSFLLFCGFQTLLFSLVGTQVTVCSYPPVLTPLTPRRSATTRTSCAVYIPPVRSFPEQKQLRLYSLFIFLGNENWKWKKKIKNLFLLFK